MSQSKIKKGDTVIVITGKYKKTVGEVLQVIPAKGKSSSTKVVVDKVNPVKKSIKRDPQKGIEGGFETKHLPIDVSNVAYYCKQSGKAAKISTKVLPNGSKKRYNKRLNEEVDG